VDELRIFGDAQEMIGRVIARIEEAQDKVADTMSGLPLFVFVTQVIALPSVSEISAHAHASKGSGVVRRRNAPSPSHPHSPDLASRRWRALNAWTMECGSAVECRTRTAQGRIAKSATNWPRGYWRVAHKTDSHRRLEIDIVEETKIRDVGSPATQSLQGAYDVESTQNVEAPIHSRVK